MKRELSPILTRVLGLASSFVMACSAVAAESPDSLQQADLTQQNVVSADEYESIVKEMRSAEENGTLSIVPVDDSFLAKDSGELRFLAGSIPHNQVRTFGQNADGFSLTFQPLLKVSGGCVPFPAVQADGNWSGGLESSGSASGGCSGSSGQIYSRVYGVSTGDHHSGARCAIIYSWYFPKDGNVVSGHRHDWENVVVWTNGCDANANVIAVSYSGHGGYKKQRVNSFTGKRVRVEYAQTFPLNFELFGTSVQGGSQPLIGWPQLTNEARHSLNTVNWGKANVPANDRNGVSNFNKAKFW